MELHSRDTSNMRKKLILITLILILLAVILVGAAYARTSIPICLPEQVCPAIMYGDGTNNSSRYHIQCWNPDGTRGNVTFYRVGGNDYFVRCE